MTSMTSPVARRVFDGYRWHETARLSFENGRVCDVLAGGTPEVDLIVPGLVDLQVNGGGGVQFNDSTTVEGIERICAAHRSLGTTSLLVTLITDTPEVTQAALVACKQARSVGVDGLAGLHLEGPHLAHTRKGAHRADLIRAMETADLERVLASARDCGRLLLTIAPEAVSSAQVARLIANDIVVSLGHSDCSATTAQAYFAAGATMSTHLFNAMSQMHGREPGLVGASLENGAVNCGLIADGFHVDDTMMRIALGAKQPPGRIFLVSDAMAVTGSELDGFTLNGRKIHRSDGRLTLDDGTLAGADISMLDAVRYCVNELGISLEATLQMATIHPARAARLEPLGSLEVGAQADFLVMDSNLNLLSVWVDGQECMRGGAK